MVFIPREPDGFTYGSNSEVMPLNDAGIFLSALQKLDMLEVSIVIWFVIVSAFKFDNVTVMDGIKS